MRTKPSLRRLLGRCGVLALLLAGALPAAVWGSASHAGYTRAGPFVMHGTTGPPLTRLCTPGTPAPARPLPGPSSGGPGGMEAPSIGFLGLTHNTAQVNFGGDISGAAGPNNYVETINTSFGIFSRGGKLLCPAMDNGTIWSGVGTACQAIGFTDAVVLFDQKAGRWFITRFASDGATPTPNWFECVAVSKTSDPTGGYFRYTFPTSRTHLPFADDYPKLGIWRDAYYMTANARTCCPGNPPGLGDTVGIFVAAFERSAMLKGLFLPFGDTTNGTTTYGGGRYLLDTAKGADLGGDDGGLVLDFNFAYNPSCAYDPRWVCPLAPPGNRLPVGVEAGERVL